MSEHPHTHWEIDKRIPLALIGTILTQIFLFGWLFSNHESRITTLEQKDMDIVTLMANVTEKMNEVTINAGETKVHLQYLSSSLKEIENLLKSRKEKQ